MHEIRHNVAQFYFGLFQWFQEKKIALQDNILMQIVLLYHSYTTCVYNFGELIGKLEKDMSKICNWSK